MRQAATDSAQQRQTNSGSSYSVEEHKGEGGPAQRIKIETSEEQKAVIHDGNFKTKRPSEDLDSDDCAEIEDVVRNLIKL